VFLLFLDLRLGLFLGLHLGGDGALLSEELPYLRRGRHARDEPYCEAEHDGGEHDQQIEILPAAAQKGQATLRGWGGGQSRALLLAHAFYSTDMGTVSPFGQGQIAALRPRGGPAGPISRAASPAPRRWRGGARRSGRNRPWWRPSSRRSPPPG